jgi:hypothetical protein
MARIRNIKPEFFVSETVSALPLRARLTWIGLWTHCDNHGRARDNTKLIKGAVWPLDNVSLKEIDEDLETLAEHGRIVRYEVAGKRYLMVTNWGEHQYGAFKGDPKYPSPVDNLCIVDGNGGSPAGQEKSSDLLDESGPGLEKSSGIQVSGVRGQGGGTRGDAPPPRCPRHLNDPTENPCRACGDARKAVKAWEAGEDVRRSAVADTLAQARADPRYRCGHGVDGGLFTHPDTGKSATCARCRHQSREEAS